MAKRKIELFIEINNEKEFYHTLDSNADKLICAEVYNTCFGSCTALDRLFATIKLDWSDGTMVLLKALCDDIEDFIRFRDRSEPVYMFIVKKKVTKVFRGVDSIRFAEVAKKELHLYKLEQQGIHSDRGFYELYEATPDETSFLNIIKLEKEQEELAVVSRRAARQAARKRHRAELMVPHLKNYNFVLFWPHTTYAHPELYGKWDQHNIVMVGREELKLSKEKAEDILYAGDAPRNEASIYQLTSGTSLAICFRLLDTDKHFVSLVRKILYEDPMNLDETYNIEPLTCQTAFDHYKSYSLTREQIWQLRRQEREKLKEAEKEKRARRFSEMIRLARQAKEEAILAKQKEKERLKIQFLKDGNLAALEKLEQENGGDDGELDVTIQLSINQLVKKFRPALLNLANQLQKQEKLPEDGDEEMSEQEDDNEYLPPAGLLIPGFYAPPNDVAKVNGLAILFPNLVSEHVTPQPEFLPPHVLVMLEITKRYAAIETLRKHRSSVIHMGIFTATTPYDAVHIAYSVKQYDALSTLQDRSDLKIAFMISIKVDLALLELMDFHPTHVSRDSDLGEDECAVLFPVYYGDYYQEFEDFCDN